MNTQETDELILKLRQTLFSQYCSFHLLFFLDHLFTDEIRSAMKSGVSPAFGKFWVTVVFDVVNSRSFVFIEVVIRSR